MSVNTLDKKRLLRDLQNREFRQIYYAEHISTALPMQTRELRKKRQLSQAALADLVGTDQKNISNWENPNYEYKPQIGTLMRLAEAFDVPLIVRFGSWEEVWDWEHNISPQKLAPNKFEEALPTLEKKLHEEAAKEATGQKIMRGKAAPLTATTPNYQHGIRNTIEATKIWRSKGTFTPQQGMLFDLLVVDKEAEATSMQELASGYKGLRGPRSTALLPKFLLPQSDVIDYTERRAF